MIVTLVKDINNSVGRVQGFCTQITELDRLNQLIRNFEQNLKLDESETLEFKSNMLLIEIIMNKLMKKENLKKAFTRSPKQLLHLQINVVEFYIGVSDHAREILGLEEDYKLLPYKKNSDGFLIKLKSSMEKMLEKHDFHSCVTERRILKTRNNKEICVIEVTPRVTLIENFVS